jgi:DNA-binding CsgD family transcriptional regulator
MSNQYPQSIATTLYDSEQQVTVLIGSIGNALTIYAYLGYLSLFVLILYGIKKWQNHQSKQPKKEHENDHKSRALLKRSLKNDGSNKFKALEKEKNDLEKELRSTKIQLVIKAKESEDKDRILQELGEKLWKMQESDSVSSIKWKEIFRILESHKQKENNTFQIQMDELNQEFTQKLKNSFPALTMYDLRLCTYIKTGLSTKEISEMMNVLPSSINVSRSRLRRKLDLDVKDDLFSFLEGI